MINKRIKFSILIIIPIIFWACAFPFIKFLLTESGLSFINLTIMRFLVVCTALFLIYIIFNKKFDRLRKKDTIPIFIIGFFGIIVYHLSLNYGEQYVSAGVASLIIATIPIFVLILSVVYLKEKLTIKKILGILISLFGVIIISLYGTANSKIEITYITGAIGVIIAALMGAFYTIVGKKMLERYSGFSLTMYAMLFGSVGLIPFYNNQLIPQIRSLSIYAWGAIIFLGLFSTITAYTFWYIALKEKDASVISTYLYATPILSTIISMIIINEQITYYFVLGGFLVIFGLILVNLKKKN